MLPTIQSHYYLPMKFHLLSCLHLLAASGPYFIPTAPRLYEIFDLVDLSAKSTPSTEVPPLLKYIIKFPTNSIQTQVVKDLIIQ